MTARELRDKLNTLSESELDWQICTQYDDGFDQCIDTVAVGPSTEWLPKPRILIAWGDYGIEASTRKL